MTDNEHRSNGLRPGEIIVDSRSVAAMVESNRRMWRALQAIDRLDEAARLAQEALVAEPEFDAIPEYVRDALLSDEAIEAAERAVYAEWAKDETTTKADARTMIAAAIAAALPGTEAPTNV